MKNKFIALLAVIFTLSSCGTTDHTDPNTPPTDEFNKSELFLHIEELSENIVKVPNFQADGNENKNLSHKGLPYTDYSQQNHKHYSPIRSINVKEMNDKIEYLKGMRNKIISNVYMLNTWINIYNENRTDTDELKEYKRVSFDYSLDMAILEYAKQDKYGVPNDFESNITNYVFLKTSYDENAKLLISGSEVSVNYFKNARSEQKTYRQESFSYHEDNYLIYLSEYELNESTSDERTHYISLLKADLTDENPILTYLNTNEISKISTGNVIYNSLSTTLFQNGVMAYSYFADRNLDYKEKLTDFNGSEHLYFQNSKGKSIAEFTKFDYQNNECSFELDLTEMSGYTSFTGEGDKITLTLKDGRTLNITNIEEDGDSIGGANDSLHISSQVTDYYLSIGFSSRLRIDIEPKKDEPIDYQIALNYVLNMIDINFKDAYPLDSQFSVLNNYAEVGSEYSFFDGNFLDRISFNQAQGIFAKYVDEDIKDFDEVLAMNFEDAIDEDEQTSDEGTYSIYASQPSGEITYNKTNNTLDFSNISLDLIPNPLMKSGDNYSLVASLKKDNGGLVQALDIETKTYNGESLFFALHDNINFPNINLGAYRVVCYLLDQNGNRISGLYYPIYNGEELLLFDENDCLINVSNNNGIYITKEGTFFKEQSINIVITYQEAEYGGQSFPYINVALDGPEVYLNTSYFPKGKVASLTLYAVSDENKVALISERGEFGTDGLLSLNNEQLFISGIDDDLNTDLTGLKAGTYHFVLEFVIGEEEYSEVTDSFECSLSLDEGMNRNYGFSVNESNTNFVLTINDSAANTY